MIHLEKSTPFPVRGFNLCESILRHSPEQLRSFIRRMKHLQMNTLIVHYDYGWKRYSELLLEECRNAGVEIVLMTFGPRTFFSLADWKQEYFAKDPEGNVYTKRPECETHPCRYVPESLDAFEYGAERWLESLPPGIKRVHMRAGDGSMFCQCERCRLLPEYDRWQPFADRFVKAVQKVRSDLKFESDIYYKRYRIPAEGESYGQMDFLMYDTFFRKPSVPLSSSLEDPVTAPMVHYADSEYCQAVEPNIGSFHSARLREWTNAFPGKMYIHENAMLQAYMGLFQYGTAAYLQDLIFYRSIGVQGVCYEAFEQGYNNYEAMFEILAGALNGEEVCYEEHPLEKHLARSSIYRFCDESSFPLEQYIQDPAVLAHQKLFCRFWQKPDKVLFRDYVEFALAQDGKLDPILIAWYCAQFGVNKKCMTFRDLSTEAQDFVKRRKLWDFMEEIPMTQDPKKVCLDIIGELLCKAE